VLATKLGMSAADLTEVVFSYANAFIEQSWIGIARVPLQGLLSGDTVIKPTTE